MILAWTSLMQKFEVTRKVAKGESLLAVHVIGQPFDLRAPIGLQLHDSVWIDMGRGTVEVVERAGIAIWRATALN